MTDAIVAPSAPQLRRVLRAARRRNHHRSMGEALTDGYMLMLFAAIYGLAVVTEARRYLHAAPGPAVPADRRWIALAAAVAGVGLAWQLLRAVGPLLATPPAYSWCASTPVDRRGWLLQPLGTLLAAAAAGTAVAGLLVGTLAGRSALGSAALAGAVAGTGGVALAVAGQSGDRRRAADRALLAAAALALTGVIAAHYARVPLPRPGIVPAAAIAAVGIPLAVAAVVAAVRSLPRLDRAALTGGAQLAEAAITATIWLDPSLLSGVLEGRRWRRIGRVTSRRPRDWRLPGGRIARRWWALLQADLRRPARRPSVLAVWVALVLAQYAVAVALPGFAALTRAIGVYLAAERLGGGLRAVCRSPGLRRALGGTDRELHAVHLVVPAVAAVLWWLATWASGPNRGLPAAAALAGAVGATYRAATRPPMNYDNLIVDTPFGPIPVDQIRQLMRGRDVVAVVVIIQALG